MDACFFEISDNAPESFYRDALEPEGFKIMSGIMSPFQMGWPCKRPRRFTFAWKPIRVDFSGSWQEFQDVFFTCPVLDGDSMFMASANDRKTYIKAKAILRGNHFEDHADIPLENALTAKEALRLASAKALAPEKKAISGAYLADLERVPKRSMLGPYVPTLLRSAQIVNVATNGPMFPREKLSVMGEACFPELESNDYPCFMWEAAREWITDHGISKAAGNAFHIVNMAAFVLYCLSCSCLAFAGRGHYNHECERV